MDQTVQSGEYCIVLISIIPTTDLDKYLIIQYYCGFCVSSLGSSSEDYLGKLYGGYKASLDIKPGKATPWSFSSHSNGHMVTQSFIVERCEKWPPFTILRGSELPDYGSFVVMLPDW